MLQSEKLDQLFSSLSKAQKEFPIIRVNRKAYKNEYADLYAILKPIYPVLEKYNLNVTAYTGFIGEKEIIGARLAHDSGQYIINALYYRPDTPKNPQDQASHKEAGTMTYMHRNFIKNILGVLISDDPEDDDMQGRYEEQKHNTYNDSSLYINNDQIYILKDLLKESPETKIEMLKKYNIATIEKLLRKDFSEAFERCKIHIKKLREQK